MRDEARFEAANQNSFPINRAKYVIAKTFSYEENMLQLGSFRLHYGQFTDEQEKLDAGLLQTRRRRDSGAA
jgi:hypothetical protein